MKAYVLTFSPVFKEKVWGGRALERVLGKILPDAKPYGESWEISAHGNGSSVITNGHLAGKTLAEILPQHGKDFVGEAIWNKYQGAFPLLLKFLDVNDKLSIQVHPSDAYALPNENSFGKAECWYILSASPDAKLIMGMKPGFNKESYLAQALAGDFNGLFEEVSVRAGDLVTIAPGMVHASLEGSILLYELQQNSDITYRIYDFGRSENGSCRPLHLDKSADVIDFSAPADIRHFPQDRDAVLLDWPYFSLKRLRVAKGLDCAPLPHMRFYTVIEGSLGLGTGESLGLGESCLVPAHCPCVFRGDALVMEAYPK